MVYCQYGQLIALSFTKVIYMSSKYKFLAVLDSKKSLIVASSE